MIMEECQEYQKHLQKLLECNRRILISNRVKHFLVVKCISHSSVTDAAGTGTTIMINGALDVTLIDPTKIKNVAK
jgi:hypothetical protein